MKDGTKKADWSCILQALQVQLQKQAEQRRKLLQEDVQLIQSNMQLQAQLESKVLAVKSAEQAMAESQKQLESKKNAVIRELVQQTAEYHQISHKTQELHAATKRTNQNIQALKEQANSLEKNVLQRFVFNFRCN